ncbi:hypothetical protein ACJA88_013639 [Fusarium oxysporum]
MTASNIPDFLFNTLVTVVDYSIDPSGGMRFVYVLGTHSTLEAAKAFATSALQGLNYCLKDFCEFIVRSAEPWKHESNRVIFARVPAEQVFRIEIDTTPNTESLLESPDGVVLRDGSTRLYYVLETIDNGRYYIDYRHSTKKKAI